MDLTLILSRTSSQLIITKTINVQEAETKWETSNGKTGAVPRCPPSRALGHYQRETQPPLQLWFQMRQKLCGQVTESAPPLLL